MNIRPTTTLILFIILCIFYSSCSEKEDEFPIPEDPFVITGSGLRVGASVTDITPAEGVYLEGYEPRQSDGIHDPLTARCLTIIDKNDKILVLIALDFIGIYGEQVKAMQQTINAYTGVDNQNIFIHAIHTHSGPDILANPSRQRDYLSTVNKNVGQAVRHALEASKNAIAIFSKGQTNAATVNRRNPERSVANKFTTIKFVDQEQNTIAMLLNYACHPVVLGPDNKKITADYVHYLRASIEESLGGTAIFFNASEGDINPPPIHQNYPYDRSGGTFAMSEQLGLQIGSDIQNAINEIDTTDVEINFRTKTISDADRQTEISIVDLGLAQLAMVPGEPISTFGNALEDMLPGKYPMIFGMTNDFIGYLMPDIEWETCSHSFKSTCYEETVSPGAGVGEILIKAYQDLSSEMFVE